MIIWETPLSILYYCCYYIKAIFYSENKNQKKNNCYNCIDFNRKNYVTISRLLKLIILLSFYQQEILISILLTISQS